MNETYKQIESQLTVLLRRVQHIHLTTASGSISVDRSAYGIMCRLADEGPQRLGALATTFGLDPSTITRQVQALEANGLAERTVDPTDRRAAILDLSEEGRVILAQAREYRRTRLGTILDDWSGQDLAEFARLLEQFNVSAEKLSSHSNSTPVPA